MRVNTKPYLRDYWAPNLGMILFWGYAVLVGVGAGFAIANGQWLLGCVLVAAIFLVRIWLETTLILFQIHDVLVDIRDQPQQQAKAPSVAGLRKVAQDAALRTVPGEHRLHID